MNTKSRTTAAILAICLGWVGMHKFYLGFTFPGFVMLFCGTVGWITCGAVPFVGFMVGVIEGILYLTKSDEEFHYEYMVNRKMWF